MNADRIIEKYVKLRDEKAELEARHKEELAPVREQMQLCEAALQKLMNDAGVKQVKGDHGTAYVVEQVSTKVEDWDGTLAYIRKNERWDLLERRVSKTALLETEDEVPGVSISRRFAVNVRRS